MLPLLPPAHEARVRLPDGRQLGYAEFGTGAGLSTATTIVWLHGTPGGRRQLPPAARVYARDHGLRVIVIERPGIGDSTVHLHDEVLGFADDIGVVLDTLGVSRCAVVGLSGGGPYTLACAYRLDAVRCCAVLGGVAPTQGPEAVPGGVTTLASFAPWVAPLRRPLSGALSLAVRAAHPLASPVFDLFVRFSRPGDQAVFSSPNMKEMFLDDMLDATRRGGLHSLLADYLLFSRDWGFRLGDIDKPVHFWQGDDDPFVPFEHGEHQARLVRGSTLTPQPGHSHLGGLDAAVEVLERMVGELSS